MAKSLAWAYGLAGATVAAAIIVVVGSTVGLTEGADNEDSTPTFSIESLPTDAAGNVLSSEVVTTASGEQIEYVYVDQPSARGDRDHDDHDDDDERHDDDDNHDEHDDDHEDDD